MERDLDLERERDLERDVDLELRLECVEPSCDILDTEPAEGLRLREPECERRPPVSTSIVILRCRFGTH